MKAIYLIILLLLISCASKNGDQLYEEAKRFYHNAEYDQACVTFIKAIDKTLTTNSYAEAYTYLGNIYSEKEQYDSSILMYKNALDFDSIYVDAWVNMGIDYRLTGDLTEAERCYMKAREINQRDPELYVSLGALNIYQGDIEKAIENLEFAIELDPTIPTAHANYALALALDGNFVAADYEIRTAVSIGYKNGDIIRDRIEELKNME